MINPTATRSYLLTLGLAASLAGCGGPPVQSGDSGPKRHVDVSKIPDAKPRHEPRSRSGNPAFYSVYGKRYYVLKQSSGYRQRGIASWYGNKFHGRKTSSGEPYNMYAMTAAHKTLPIPTYLRVTNLNNGRSIIVRVNDRGPFVKNRIIDLSYVAARKLGIIRQGTGMVEISAITPGEPPRTLSAKNAASPRSNTRPGAAHQRLFVQVGAFSTRHNARQLSRRLQHIADGRIRIEAGHDSRRNPVFRVRIGPLKSVSEADRMTTRLAQIGHQDTRIIID
jgi:rare lipoprotein A